MDAAAPVAQMVFSLIAVVAIILGLAWMTRRMQGLRGGVSAELRVRATLAVGLKERVVLIEAQGQQFLIGVAPGQVNLIQALGLSQDEPAIAPPTATGEAAPVPRPGERMPLSSAFAIQLNKLLGR